MDEQPQINTPVRELWAQFFPTRDTLPDAIPAAVANKDWIRDSLIYYGWKPGADKLNVTITFIDGGAVLMYERTQPCALITIKDGKINITYVNNNS